jgi:hypothetical protein
MIAAVTESIVKSLLKEVLNAIGSEACERTFCSTRSMIRRTEEKKHITKITMMLLCSFLIRERELKPPAPLGAGNKNSAGLLKMDAQ